VLLSDLAGVAVIAQHSSAPTRASESGDVPITTGNVDAAECLTAYHTLDCESHGQALSVAKCTLDSHVTSVEVRQIHHSFGLERPFGFRVAK
jgi:hypothetical protein